MKSALGFLSAQTNLEATPKGKGAYGLSRVSRWRLEQENEFPHRVQITSHSIGWRLSEVMAWLESRPRRTYGAETAPEAGAAA